MKKLFAGLICVLMLAGCKDDLASAGAGALMGDEEVRVRSGVLANMSSNTDAVTEFKITQTPDSFLLGAFNTGELATIKADLMTQFAYPVEFTYPAGSVIDSISLYMTYSSWFADGNRPLNVAVYAMDLNTMEYEGVYPSDTTIQSFISTKTTSDGRVVVDEKTHVVEADQVVVAAQPKEKVYSSTEGKYYPVIHFKMNQKFVDKMNRKMKFKSQADFNEFFKGLYITTNAGASTVLYVGNITMIMYYHYNFQETPESPVRRATDSKLLYANSEVRQVNMYSFPDKAHVVDSLQKHSDSANFVVSPGYVYTTLKLPMKQYVDTILNAMKRAELGDTLQPYINKASMRVEVLNVGNTSTTTDKWADPATYMLLIRRDSLQSFFTNKNLPSSDYCLLSALNQTINSDYSVAYYYDFDMSTLLHNEVRRKMRNADVEDMEMVMVPVFAEFSTSSSTTVVSQVKLNQTITFTTIHSAQYKNDPLDIDVVFSGFTIK